MEKGQLVFYWKSLTTGSINYKVDSVVSAIMYNFGFTFAQVDDESVGFNIGGLFYIDEDGEEMEFHLDNLDEFDDLVDELLENEAYTREDIIKYIKKNNIKPCQKYLKMY